jgi:hypothetical protein
MKSENFEMLRQRWPELAALGGFAEAYAHADPASALVKLRLFAENMTKDAYRDLRLPKPDQPTFVDLLKKPIFRRDHAEGCARQAPCSPNSRQQSGTWRSGPFPKCALAFAGSL